VNELNRKNKFCNRQKELQKYKLVNTNIMSERDWKEDYPYIFYEIISRHKER
jgi:hypothetical protein